MEETTIQIIREIMQHIAVLNDDYSALSIDVAVLKSQMAQIVWFVKTIFGAILIMLVTQAYQIFQIRKNGKK